MKSIITNNPLIIEKYENVILVDGDFKEVLELVRDKIYSGYRLVSHPLPASSKMFSSPIRSVIIGEKDIPRLNELDIVENSIRKYDQLMAGRQIDYKNQKDYELIDKSLIEEALI